MCETISFSPPHPVVIDARLNQVSRTRRISRHFLSFNSTRNFHDSLEELKSKMRRRDDDWIEKWNWNLDKKKGMWAWGRKNLFRNSGHDDIAISSELSFSMLSFIYMTTTTTSSPSVIAHPSTLWCDFQMRERQKKVEDIWLSDFKLKCYDMQIKVVNSSER